MENTSNLLIDITFLSVLFAFITVTVYIKFEPVITKSGKYLILSYWYRDEYGERTHREFCVFDIQAFKFVKGSF